MTCASICCRGAPISSPAAGAWRRPAQPGVGAGPILSGRQHQRTHRVSEHGCRHSAELRQPRPRVSGAIHLPIFDAGPSQGPLRRRRRPRSPPWPPTGTPWSTRPARLRRRRSNLSQIQAQSTERRKSLNAAMALQASAAARVDRVSSIRGWSCARTTVDPGTGCGAPARCRGGVVGHRTQARIGRGIPT